VAFETHHTATTREAHIALLLCSVFERSGTFVNQQWRAQKFTQAIPAAAGVSTDIALLDRLLQKLGESALPAPTPEAVWKLMAATLPILKGLSFANLGAKGVVIDSVAYAAIDFPETKTLHHERATATVA